MKVKVCHLLFSNSQEFLNVAFLKKLVANWATCLVSICIQLQKYGHIKLHGTKQLQTDVHTAVPSTSKTGIAPGEERRPENQSERH